MATQKKINEWHSELRIICGIAIASDKKRQIRIANGKADEADGFDVMRMFREHFAKVAVKQNSEMDGILGYEDMVDYAKWYISGDDIVKQ
jgi:hypothetical protein